MLQSLGFSLIEVQVSLLLVTISVAGVARLQLVSHQEIEHAHYVGQAYELLEEASRRISLNSNRSNDYLINELNGYPPYQCLPCSPEQMVKLDHSHLSQSLIESLPASSARISNCNQGLCMTVAWNEADVDACDESVTCVQRSIW